MKKPDIFWSDTDGSIPNYPKPKRSVGTDGEIRKGQKMKAISLKQPWAWLMVNGYKMPEFRNRRDSFRGECYVHASKQMDKTAFDWIAMHIPFPYIKEFMTNRLPPLGMFNVGKIIGKFTVMDCLPVALAREKYPNDIWLKMAGDSLGKYAFITESPISLPPHEQFEIKGKVSPLFWDVPSLPL